MWLILEILRYIDSSPTEAMRWNDVFLIAQMGELDESSMQIDDINMGYDCH